MVDGPLVHVHAAHARAAVESRRRRCSPTSSTATRRSTSLGLAAEAAAELADLHRARAEARLATAAAHRSADLADRAGGLRTPALARGGGVEPLTAREREVALLAAAGRSSRDIGDRLGLSTRTVDTHLARVYRKLGIAGRADLAQRSAWPALRRPRRALTGRMCAAVADAPVLLPRRPSTHEPGRHRLGAALVAELEPRRIPLARELAVSLGGPVTFASPRAAGLVDAVGELVDLLAVPSLLEQHAHGLVTEWRRTASAPGSRDRPGSPPPGFAVVERRRRARLGTARGSCCATCSPDPRGGPRRRHVRTRTAPICVAGVDAPVRRVDANCLYPEMTMTERHPTTSVRLAAARPSTPRSTAPSAATTPRRRLWRRGHGPNPPDRTRPPGRGTAADACAGHSRPAT